MKITVESTSKVVDLVDNISGHSVPARVWEGTTANGIPVHCFVTRLLVKRTHDQAQFEAELAAEPNMKASADFDAIPNRLIL